MNNVRRLQELCQYEELHEDDRHCVGLVRHRICAEEEGGKMYAKDLKPGDRVSIWPYGFCTVESVKKDWRIKVAYSSPYHGEIKREYWGHEDLDAI